MNFFIFTSLKVAILLAGSFNFYEMIKKTIYEDCPSKIDEIMNKKTPDEIATFAMECRAVMDREYPENVKYTNFLTAVNSLRPATPDTDHVDYFLQNILCDLMLMDGKMDEGFLDCLIRQDPTIMNETNSGGSVDSTLRQMIITHSIIITCTQTYQIIRNGCIKGEKWMFAADDEAKLWQLYRVMQEEILKAHQLNEDQ